VGKEREVKRRGYERKRCKKGEGKKKREGGKKGEREKK